MLHEDNIISSSIKLSELEAHIGVKFENKNHLKKALEDEDIYYEIARIYSIKKRKEEVIYYLKKAIDILTRIKLVYFRVHSLEGLKLVVVPVVIPVVIPG